MFSTTKVITFATAIASLATSAMAHSWVEEIRAIGPNGSYVNLPGFIRGYVSREDPSYIDSGALVVQHLLPGPSAALPTGVRNRLNSSDFLCHESQRTPRDYTAEYPRLQVAPGSYVAMKYLENGHTTLPWNQKGKPANGSGTVYVYGTTRPIDDERIVEVMKWTTDGTGGDRRGRLLAMQNFDDGRCHQVNPCYLSVERQAAFPNIIPLTTTPAEQLCETDVKVPDDASPGTPLAVYWVWQWPTAPGADCGVLDGKDEYYTSCADFDIVDEGTLNNAAKIAAPTSTMPLPGGDAQSTAVSTYKSRTAISSWTVSVQEWTDYLSATPTVTYKADAAVAKSCASVSYAASTLAAAQATGFIPSGAPACPSDKYATGTLAAYYSSKGIASAKAAAEDQRTGASVPAPAPTGAPVDTSVQVAPTQSAPSQPAPSQPAVGGSATVSIITVESTITTQYTSTVTLLPNTASANPGQEGPYQYPYPQLPTVFTVHGNARATASNQAAPAYTAPSEAPTTDNPDDSCDDAPPPPAEAVYVPTTGPAIAKEHIARHRARGRRFAA